METAVNPTELAALVGLAIGLVKVLEIAVKALAHRVRPPKAQLVEVKLAKDEADKLHDTWRLGAEIHTNVAEIRALVAKTDNDGTPMVYSSRSGTEAVRDTAVIIRNVMQTQERILGLIERLEDRFAQHDRTDQAVQSSIIQSLERLAKSQEDHDRWVREHGGQ